MDIPLETIPTNPKHKREVCRYWMKNLCTKGSSCEFLHMWDQNRMPKCLQPNCTDKQCPFTHTVKENVCANYMNGFCSFGNNCPHQHVPLDGPPPDVAALWTTEDASIEYAEKMRNAKTFRKKPCSYWITNGWCPYFEMCNFTHEQ